MPGFLGEKNVLSQKSSFYSCSGCMQRLVGELVYILYFFVLLIMPRNYPANPKKIWTPASMELAVKEHIEDGVSIRNVITFRVRRYRDTLLRRKQGRKPVFSEQELNDLNRCIVDLASLGFPMINNDLGEHVESHSIANNVTHEH